MADPSDVNCSLVIPTTQHLFGPGLSIAGAVFVGISCVLIAVIITFYIEQMVYLQRHCKPCGRRNTTFTLLSLFPFVAFCSFLSIIIPRSGAIVDMMNNTYIAYCMETFMRHIESYYGSAELLCKALDGSTIKLRTPPCCCCCLCLPELPMNSKNYGRLRCLVLQASVARPILMILAAVLWTNGDYLPGVIALDSSYIYVAILNMLITMPASYALLRIVDLTKTQLSTVRIQARALLLQGVVISTVVFNLITGIVVKAGGFPCTIFFSSANRGERIYHFMLILLMLPLCLLGRIYYLPNRMAMEHVYIVKEETVVAPSTIENKCYIAEDKELPAVSEHKDQGIGMRDSQYLSPIV